MGIVKSRERLGESGLGRSVRRGGRNDGLASIGGRLRKAGLEVPDLIGALEGINESRCLPPLGSAEVRKIAETWAR